jgi:SAM-dependent methyltransferase
MNEGKQVQSNWQTDFFRGVALEMWRRAVTPQQTCADVEFLERALKMNPGGRLLDVPCGNGRHAVEFASRGYPMTGVDSSEEFIVEARGRIDARWILGDMCNLPWTGEFDGAYCFGNSFGYLDREGVRKFLGAVADALKPGARFAIETGMAAESILPTLVRNRWFRLGDLFMLSENQYDAAASRLDIQYTFIHEGKVDTRPSSSYVFTVAELIRLHAEAEFETIELLGSVAGDAYQLGSQRLILVSQKR